MCVRVQTRAAVAVVMAARPLVWIHVGAAAMMWFGASAFDVMVVSLVVALEVADARAQTTVSPGIAFRLGAQRVDDERTRALRTHATWAVAALVVAATAAYAADLPS